MTALLHLSAEGTNSYTKTVRLPTATISMHYNIAKKTVINPFEEVKFIKLVTYSSGNHKLQVFLNTRSNTVDTRCINGEWVILYDIQHLDFTTIVNWFEPTRGKFQFGNTFIHFRIEDDLLVCW